jgi:hypothetical protein
MFMPGTVAISKMSAALTSGPSAWPEIMDIIDVSLTMAREWHFPTPQLLGDARSLSNGGLCSGSARRNDSPPCIASASGLSGVSVVVGGLRQRFRGGTTPA